MKKSDSIVEIAKALAAFQAEVEQPKKSAENPFFGSDYVPLEAVVETIKNYAPKNGLSFTQWPCTNEQGRTGVATMLFHSSGEWIEYDPVYMKSDKDTAQAGGSVITYCKRYALSAVFGITSDEDDDGNGATGNSAKKNKTTKKNDDF